jgi:transcriptional regulator
MEEQYLDSHLNSNSDCNFDCDAKSNSDEDGNESKFSFIIRNLPARERNALKILKITSIDTFCKYDFTELFAIRGYGETTITRLQALQKRLQSKDLHNGLDEELQLTIQSPIENAGLSQKEQKALASINVTTIEEFLNLNLSEVVLPKGFGNRTHRLLIQSKKRVANELSAKIPRIPTEERPALMFPLNPRERKLVAQLNITSWQEFACYDFQQIDSISNVGTKTLRSLFAKQMEIRTKIIRAKIESLSNFSYDEEYSVFLLDLELNAKEVLCRLGITRISELTKTNLTVLKFVEDSMKDAYEKLYQIQCEFSQIIKETENPLNDFLETTPLASVGISETVTEFLQQNSVNSLRDFLFFSIPEEHHDLQPLQSEWRNQHTPAEFLRIIPSYFNILFHCQKKKTQNSFVGDCLNNFETIKDFFSATFEDIVKLTDNDMKTVQEIQSAQYELLKSCLDFHKCFDFSVNDEREECWMQPINNDSLTTLPFFNSKHNRNFSPEMFHETFLPGLSLSTIVRGRMLKVIKQIGIKSLGELLLITPLHFRLLKYCSKIRIAEVQEKIQKIFFSITDNSTKPSDLIRTKGYGIVLPSLLSPLDKSTPQTFLLSLLKRYIPLERTIDVIVRRVHGKTLEQIAKIYGLTRERIRQIERRYKNPSDFAYAQVIFAEVSQMLEKTMTTLGGFSTLRKITTQFAEDNGWAEQDCSPLFVKFLLDHVTDKIVSYGKGYYAIKSYPCNQCERLAAKISEYAEREDQEIVTRSSSRKTFLNTCCTGCTDFPHRINDFFLDWKCSSDPLYFQLFNNDDLCRSATGSMQKMVHNILKRSANPLSVKEILALVCYRAGNDNFTLEQVRDAVTILGGKKKDIFLWNRGGIYAHRKHLPIDNPLLLFLENKLKQLLKKITTPISLYILFNEYKSECQANGIPSVYALHACLKARGVLGVAFRRTPCVSATSKKHKRKNVEILESWVARQKKVVTGRALERYALEVGIDSQQCYSAFVYSKLLIKYKHGLVVHLDSLGWNQEKQEAMLILAMDYWHYLVYHGELFARTDLLLAEYGKKLPKLANGIPWSSRLLFSLLSLSEAVNTFGNTHLAYGFKNSTTAPQSFDDIVIETLKNKFNGRAKLTEFSSYLRDEFRLIHSRLTPSMLQNCSEIILTDYEVYLIKSKKLP